MLTVVLGPRTRLAAALLGSVRVPDVEWVLVAREAAEAAALAATHRRAAILRAWEDLSNVPAPRDEMAIVSCALGPIHPTRADTIADTRALLRDLAVVEALLRAGRAVPVHVVLVSSVLALSPRTARAYYAGWKGVADGSLARLVDDHPRARLSVLYPGRLVEGRSPHRPSSLLYTTYSDMADAVIRQLRTGHGERRIVGMNARLWLASRGLGSMWAALRGRP